MNRRTVGLCSMILASAVSICAQTRVDEHGVVQLTEEEIAANKQLHELLQKPDFITLRLTYGYVYEKPVETPQPYRVGDSMYFELFVSQSLFEDIMVEYGRWAHYEYRPELRRDGEILSFSKEAQKAVEKADHEPPSWSTIPVNLAPGREYQWPTVRLGDWYDRLGPGHYELSVRKRFVWDGDWVQSNSVTFDVQPRKPPTPIPPGVTVEMVPEDFQLKPKQKLYHLSGEIYVSVVVVNNSQREVPSPAIDIYYGNRPQLFKEGVLLPFLDEITKLLNAKEQDSRSGDVSLGVSLPPGTRTGVQGLNLTKWYGQLGPGHYRLINRHRFEIDGPWTADSAELLFEILR